MSRTVNVTAIIFLRHTYAIEPKQVLRAKLTQHRILARATLAVFEEHCMSHTGKLFAPQLTSLHHVQ